MEQPHQHSSSPPERSHGDCSRSAPGIDEAVAARRRALLRTAAASAPLFLASSVGAQVAQGSLTAADKDAGRPAPGVPVEANDTWIRRAVRFGDLKLRTTGQVVYQGVYEIAQDSKYFRPGIDGYSAGTQVPFNQIEHEFVDAGSPASPQWVLVLFPTGQFETEAGLWPEFATGDAGNNAYQGLHCSAWGSIGGDNRYQCAPVAGS